MTFTRSREALAGVSGRIRQDLEAAIASVENLAGKDKQAAGHRTSRLVTAFALNGMLPIATRFSLVDAVLMDAENNGLPFVSQQ
jgi:hypothetical protein